MFSHSPTEGHLDCFQFENLFTNKVVISIYIQFLVCTEIFIFLNAQEWNAQLQGSCMVNLIRNCQSALWTGWNISPSHQQCMNDPGSPYTGQNLVSVFFILAILVDR